MTRAEFIQRAALTYGAEGIKALKHIQALADAVDEVAPFDRLDQEAALVSAVLSVAEELQIRNDSE